MAIASCLVDTNILLRLARSSDPQHNLIYTAVAKLASEGSTLHYTHQNIAELWNVMTRPVTRNGFGLTAAEAEREVRVIEAGMTLLPENEGVYREWRRIVVGEGVHMMKVRPVRRFPPFANTKSGAPLICLAAELWKRGCPSLSSARVGSWLRGRGRSRLHRIYLGVIVLFYVLL